MFAKGVTTIWGILSIFASVFGMGFAVGVYYQEAIEAEENTKDLNEYSLKLIECENEHIREVVDLKERYNNEINELKNRLYEKECK